MRRADICHRLPEREKKPAAGMMVARHEFRRPKDRDR